MSISIPTLSISCPHPQLQRGFQSLEHLAFGTGFFLSLPLTLADSRHELCLSVCFKILTTTSRGPSSRLTLRTWYPVPSKIKSRWVTTGARFVGKSLEYPPSARRRRLDFCPTPLPAMSFLGARGSCTRLLVLPLASCPAIRTTILDSWLKTYWLAPARGCPDYSVTLMLNAKTLPTTRSPGTPAVTPQRSNSS
jgi:hypothetical protein